MIILYSVRRYNLRFLLYPSELHLNSIGFLGLPLLDPSHISMHFVLLYFMPVAYWKRINCVLRCSRELLFLMYIAVPSTKVKVFCSFSPVRIPLMSLWLRCLIFSKKIFVNIMYRIIDNGHPCRSPLFIRKACVRCPFTLTCVSVLINCFYFLHYFGSVSKML